VEIFSVFLSYDPTLGDHSLIDSQSICSKARKILGLLHRRFNNNAPRTPFQLYTSLVHAATLIMPWLAIWSPHLKKDKVALENIQKSVCRMVTRAWD